MHKITAKTRQGNIVERLSKTQARKNFYAGSPITSTVAGELPINDPDVTYDDGTDKMVWPSVTDFDSWANEQAFYAPKAGVWYWGFKVSE